jgi:hypothetical protein
MMMHLSHPKIKIKITLIKRTHHSIYISEPFRGQQCKSCFSLSLLKIFQIDSIAMLQNLQSYTQVLGWEHHREDHYQKHNDTSLMPCFTFNVMVETISTLICVLDVHKKLLCCLCQVLYRPNQDMIRHDSGTCEPMLCIYIFIYHKWASSKMQFTAFKLDFDRY